MNNQGGKREGAGRPPVLNKSKNRTFKLTDAQYARMKELGGVKWLKSLLIPHE
jgi:hypothetical protein